MKKQKIRDDGDKVGKLKSDHFFNVFAPSFFSNEKVVEIQEKEAGVRREYHPVNLESAKEKLQNDNMNAWLRQKKVGKNESVNLYQFVIEFFNELDTDKCGKLKGEKLLESLVYLGIASDPSAIRRTLCLIYKCKNLKNLKINSKHFIGLFKNDWKTDKLLKCLNEKCQKVKVGQKSKLFGESASGFNRTNTSQFRGNINGKEQEQMVTINEHIELIGNWWKFLDKNSTNQVKSIEVIQLFISESLAADKNEAKTLINPQGAVKPSMVFDDFQQVFAKSMLKGALLNLSKRMAVGEYSNKELSPGFRLQSYQRALILSGVNCPNSEITEEEGSKTISAIEKYNSAQSKPEK